MPNIYEDMEDYPGGESAPLARIRELLGCTDADARDIYSMRNRYMRNNTYDLAMSLERRGSFAPITGCRCDQCTQWRAAGFSNLTLHRLPHEPDEEITFEGGAEPVREENARIPLYIMIPSLGGRHVRGVRGQRVTPTVKCSYCKNTENIKQDSMGNNYCPDCE